MARFFSALLWIFISLLIIAPLTLWAALALWFRFPGPEWVRAGAAGLFALLGLATVVLLFTRGRLKAVTTYALAFVVVGLWFSTIMPPVDGDWAPEVARQTTATLNGDILTLSDVREFEWRSDKEFDEHWSKRSYDLSKLNSLDLFLAYWAGPKMAHLIMTFGFDGGDKLAWSVEVRPERNGEFSPIADAFKSHTLIYLATSERDSVRLRSNVRDEDVRLYRINTTPENARILLLQYADEANALASQPAFFNSITTNCTTAVVKLIRAAGGSSLLPLDWRLLVNGFLPSYLYDHNAVVTSIPLSELMALARINERARAADQSPDFSRLIRVGVPSPRVDAAAR